MIRNAIAACVLLFVGVFHTHALGAEKIYLNSGIRDPFTTRNKDGFVDLVVKEAFARIGVEAEVVVYQNASKSLSNANAGVDDGAALRIKGTNKKFTNLVMVPEKLMDNDFVAYYWGINIKIDDWESLNKYKVAYIDGWQIFEDNTKGHPALSAVENPQMLFDELSQLKVDIILYERWQGLWRARELGLDLTANEPPLASMEMYMYLNIKHEDKVEAVAKSLADMKKDGTYEKIYNLTLGKYLN